MLIQLSMPLARRTDPTTAHLAAHAVTPGISALDQAIMGQSFRLSPRSAFQIAEGVSRDYPNRWDEGTVRTRVSALGKAGVLVKVTEKGASPRGRTCDLWVQA